MAKTKPIYENLARRIECSTNQIWKCKTTYIDSLGKEVHSDDDFFVFIKSEPYHDGKDEIVRVCLISFDIDYRTEEDHFISDKDIFNHPFIIETWNDQPILTGILEKCLGTVKIPDKIPLHQKEYTKEQIEFRKSELRRAAFLYQSILSSIAKNDAKVDSRTIPLAKHKWMLAIAASIIGIGLFISQPGKLSNDDLFQSYAEAYPNKNTVTIEQSGSSRGASCNIEGFSLGECLLLQSAIDCYEKQEYSDAAELFNRINDLQERNMELFFIYAISQLYSGQGENSIASFEYLLKSDSFDEISNLLYYYALAYIKDDQVFKARRVLNHLKKHDPQYYDEISDIKKDLRWF